MSLRPAHLVAAIAWSAACELGPLPNASDATTSAGGGGGAGGCGTAEIPCNGLDDDCDPSTPDAVDADRDGASACVDCDDNDPARRPGATEICGDGIDQDCSGSDAACTWRFEDVTLAAGLTAVRDWDPAGLALPRLQGLMMSGGVAASDIDGDGFVDLYVTGCTLGSSALYHNQGDGHFVDQTATSGIVPSTPCEAGPVFGDITGDGLDDLFVGGVDSTPARLWVGQPGGTFVDGTSAAGLDGMTGNTMSGALADTDLDGDLDVALGRWTASDTGDDAYFENESGVLIPSTAAAGLGELKSVTFTPSFADLDGDGLLDLLFVSDFHQTRLYWGNGDGTFLDATTPVLSDQNGMGSAIGDVDGDGDLDWFVSSIWDPDGLPEGGWGTSGNRLYLNQGDGTLVDGTAAAGVRVGYWGWGACLADFDNDGDLDLFHTNGIGFREATDFFEDPSMLYISSGDGTFTDRAAELGVVDTGQGRGIVCFDYDRDGDIDILIEHNRGGLTLYRNNGAGVGHYFDVAVAAPAPNARAIGARIEITAGGKTRVGLVRAGSNYASQDPAEVHFGLGGVDAVDSVTVRRPGGSVTTFGAMPADQRVVLTVP
ncbi:MAG TPA: FG-GAP-like repeat-containing protein [Polyangiaceae bacterium]|nr:FG-GAP-like repeat-containing protein [Polyangiaceae bacterium]